MAGQMVGYAPGGGQMLVQSPPSDPGNFAKFRTQMRESPEDIWQPIYDRKNFPQAGTFELLFFSIPLGSPDTLIRGGSAASVTKTYRDTNLTQAGVLPTKAFKMHGLSLTLIPLQQAVAGAATQSILDDMQRILFGGFLVLTIVDKPYLTIPLNKIPSTGVVRGTAGGAFTAGNVAVAAGGSGTGAPRDIYWFGVPLVLDPYQNFGLRMQFDGSPSLIQTYDVQVFLEGYMRRPGQ